MKLPSPFALPVPLSAAHLASRQPSSAACTELPAFLSTNELAALCRQAPQTIRRNHCENGHYHGIKPVKLPNGRLCWRSSDAVALLNGELK